MQAIVQRYDLGSVDRVAPIKTGLVHQTWRIETSRGWFVLQRLHPVLGTAEIMRDYRAVTEHLAQRGFLAPRLVPTRAGHDVAIDDEDRWWRMTRYVPGDIRSSVTSVGEAEQGARVLGRFHRVMADIDHRFESEHPLHDTSGHLQRMNDAAEAGHHTEARLSIQAELETVAELLPPLMLPEGLPQRVVHGDPKISNVVFESRDNTRTPDQTPLAIALIDLDTCSRHNVIVDLGDAIRSWCRRGRDDESERFFFERFEAILRGYAAEGPALRPEEIALVPTAGRLITLELASRFARDVLEDAYFAWDSALFPNRRAHNRARTRRMIELAADMAARQHEIDDAVSRALGHAGA